MLLQDTQKLWQDKMSLLKTVLSTSDNNINESKIKDKHRSQFPPDLLNLTRNSLSCSS